MQALTELVLLKTKNGWFTKREALDWLGKGGAAFDGVLKRALATGEILRVARGLYCLRSDLLACKLDPHVFAPLICEPSYLSFESALAYRGWIPEAVFSFASASLGRSREFETPFGVFSYRRVPQESFYAGVERVELETCGAFFVAEPLKAIADLLYLNGYDWDSSEPVLESLRVEWDNLRELKGADFEGIEGCYRSGRVKNFLSGLRKDLGQ
jgi:predicted transcriptional regulator of viral defense system